MKREEEALALLERVLGFSSLEGEAIFSSRETNLTRFAQNEITQNVAGLEEKVIVRLQQGRREGRAQTNQTDEASLRRAVEAAEEVLRLSKEGEELPPLLEGPQEYGEVEAYVEETSTASPATRAEVIGQATERCRQEKMEGSGVCSTGREMMALAGSRGVRASYRSTNSTFSLTAVGSDSGAEGWAEVQDASLAKLGVSEAIERSVQKARAAAGATTLSPGRYTVILEPAAVTELAMFWNLLGFGSRNYVEGRSYLKGRLGKKLFSSRLTLRDDFTRPEIQGVPFDFEGSPRQALTLIDRGVAAELAWDRRTAQEARAAGISGGAGEKIESTGHALPQPNNFGPLPFYLVMEGGEATLDELIASTNEGLLVTRFHYSNIVDPLELSITGMTRSGLYQIEGGQVVGPVRNFRYTVSLLDIFSEENVSAVGQAVSSTGSLFWDTPVIMAPLKLRSFQMSSGTDF